MTRRNKIICGALAVVGCGALALWFWVIAPCCEFRDIDRSADAGTRTPEAIMQRIGAIRA